MSKLNLMMEAVAGRPGLHLWINWKGDGEAWQTFNLAALHNEKIEQGAPRFCEDYVHPNASAAFNVSQSSAYNSVVAIGPTAAGEGRAVICYPLGGSDLHPKEFKAPADCYSNFTHVYCMQLALDM